MSLTMLTPSPCGVVEYVKDPKSMLGTPNWGSGESSTMWGKLHPQDVPRTSEGERI
jgi:hypothetical protein